MIRHGEGGELDRVEMPWPVCGSATRSPGLGIPAPAGSGDNYGRRPRPGQSGEAAGFSLLPPRELGLVCLAG